MAMPSTGEHSTNHYYGKKQEEGRTEEADIIDWTVRAALWILFPKNEEKLTWPLCLRMIQGLHLNQINNIKTKKKRRNNHK